MPKVYLITYNTDANFNKATFHSYVTSLYPAYISDWWHYTDNTYIVTTTLPVNSLYNIIYPGVPRRYLLIVEIKPETAQGWLPKGAWSWLEKYWGNTN